MSDNRKVVSVPETHDIDSVSDYVKNFVSYNPQTDFADSSSPELNNVSQDNELPPPLILHEGEPNKHQIKHIITEINGHFPKKLTPIPKGSALEKSIARSTKDKIASGPQGKYIKKVLALPIDSPLKNKITVPENPVLKQHPAVTDFESPVKKVMTEAESPVGTVIGNHGSPIQTVKTDHERLKKMVTKHFESPHKKVTTIHESAMNKVIAIPEMQYQNEILSISNKNIHNNENSIPIENQGKKVIKIIQTDGTTALPLNKKAVQVLGKKNSNITHQNSSKSYRKRRSSRNRRNAASAGKA